MMSQIDQRVLAVLAVFSPCGGIGHTQHAMGILGLDALWGEEYAAITRRRAERTSGCTYIPHRWRQVERARSRLAVRQ